MGTCYVSFTMDCEAVATDESPLYGPETWELAGRSIDGFVAALRERGHHATLFAVPHLAEVHAGLLVDLQDDDCEIAMHYHPQSPDCGHDGYLGEFSADRQRAMLQEGMGRITGKTGVTPESFRPGNFSANDATFGVLADLGFRQGSVSLPGRVRREFSAVWDGAPPFAHRPAADDRNLCGDLDFWEFPICAETDPHLSGPFHNDNLHLRIEGQWFIHWSDALLGRYVRQMIMGRRWPKVIVLMTHNLYPYDGPQDHTYRALEHICHHLEQTMRRHGLQMRPASLAQIGAELREG